MSLLKIARLGNPVIRGATTLVSNEQLATTSIQDLIDNMIETMRDAEGVGIAAPQVHELLKIIVIEVLPENRRYPHHDAIPLMVIINPIILSKSDNQLECWEGCLSVPDMRAFVPRSSSLLVSGLDRFGQPLEIEANGFLARIIQHEVDHLEGTVYLDRLPNLNTLTHLREYDRYWKK